MARNSLLDEAWFHNVYYPERFTNLAGPTADQTSDAVISYRNQIGRRLVFYFQHLQRVADLLGGTPATFTYDFYASQQGNAGDPVPSPAWVPVLDDDGNALQLVFSPAAFGNYGFEILVDRLPQFDRDNVSDKRPRLRLVLNASGGSGSWAIRHTVIAIATEPQRQINLDPSFQFQPGGSARLKGRIV